LELNSTRIGIEVPLLVVLPFTPWFIILSWNLPTFTIVKRPDTTLQVLNFLWGCLQGRYAHPKRTWDKRVEYLTFLDLGY